MMSSERAVFFRVAFTRDISQFPFPRHPESEKFFGFLMKHVMATAQIRVGFSDTRRSLNCVAKVIGHIRVTVCLVFEASLGAQLLKGKCV